jgi:hypothetical protein
MSRGPYTWCGAMATVSSVSPLFALRHAICGVCSPTVSRNNEATVPGWGVPPPLLLSRHTLAGTCRAAWSPRASTVNTTNSRTNVERRLAPDGQLIRRLSADVTAVKARAWTAGHDDLPNLCSAHVSRPTGCKASSRRNALRSRAAKRRLRRGP